MIIQPPFTAVFIRQTKVVTLLSNLIFDGVRTCVPLGPYVHYASLPGRLQSAEQVKFHPIGCNSGSFRPIWLKFSPDIRDI